MMEQRIPLFVGLVMGLGVCFVSVRELLRKLASRHWRQSVGSVSAVTIERDGDGDFYPCLQYEYRFAGALHKGREWLGEGSIHRLNAEALASSYPPGRQITIYVDEKRPSRSTLEPGVSHKDFVAVAICFLLLWMVVTGF